MVTCVLTHKVYLSTHTLRQTSIKETCTGMLRVPSHAHWDPNIKCAYYVWLSIHNYVHPAVICDGNVFHF